MTYSPRELNDLRRAWEMHPESFGYDAGRWFATIDALRAATSSAAPELDVDRLARAIGGLTDRIGIEFWREPITLSASLIAAEYARLSVPERSA